MNIYKRSSRQYKSGTGWCVWRWTYVPSDYITRLHVVKTPWCALMIHWINGPDPEPDLHDHPVTFLSIILRGGYTEFVGRKAWRDLRNIRWWNFIRAGKHVHRIAEVLPNTVTLCFVGPKTREWGFHTKDGWVYWKDYNKKYKALDSGKGPLYKDHAMAAGRTSGGTEPG